MATIVWTLRAGLAQSIVIFYPGVFVFWLIVHNNIERLRAWGTRAYVVAILAWIVTAAPLLYFRRDLFSVRWDLAEPLASGLGIVGVVALIVAVIVLRAAGRQISLRTMVGMPEIKPSTHRQPVLDSGIYSKTRNPIYFAHWLLVFSAAALSNFPANWAMFLLDCLILPLLIRAEERELLSRYGRGFADYMSRVPRFFPQLR